MSTMASAHPRTAQLSGAPLSAVRVGWAIALAFAAAAYWEMTPSNYRVTATEWSVEEAYWGVSAWLTYRQWVQTVMALEYLVGAVFIVTALLIFWRCSRDWVAVTISASLLLFSVFFGIHGNLETLHLPPLLDPIFHATAPFFPFIQFCSFLTFFYVFPNGRFVPRWSGWFVALLLALVVIGQSLDRQVWFEGSEIGWRTFMVVAPVALITGLGAQVYRYSRVATPSEQQQTKWVVYGLGLSFGLLILGLLLSLRVDGDGRRSSAATLLFVVEPVALLALPLSLALALLRFRLWDVDFVISRTLLYAAMTGVVLLIYGAVVGGASVLLGLQQSVWTAIFATGLIAVLIQSIQRRLQIAINRLAFGARDDHIQVLQLMGRQLESAATPEVALAAMTQTIAQSLKLPYAALKLVPFDADDAEPGSGRTITAAWGSPTGELERFPLTFQSTVLGDLVVAPRTRGERLSHADRRLLESIALQAGPAVQAMLLTGRLQASHRAVIAAREDERRRLRRDLHDGLGPQLASQTLTIDAIARYMEHNPVQAATLLQDLKRQSQDAVLDIRRIVYALRPPALDDLGLIEALREFAVRAAHNGVQIELDAASELPLLPAAVEVAAYRIVQEALSNALRHAHAGLIRAEIALKDNDLVIRVSDNGAGLSAASLPGVGLRSMRERAAELGGTLTLQSSPAGTTVQAVLPFR